MKSAKSRSLPRRLVRLLLPRGVGPQQRRAQGPDPDQGLPVSGPAVRLRAVPAGAGHLRRSGAGARRPAAGGGGAAGDGGVESGWEPDAAQQRQPRLRGRVRPG